MAAQREPIGLLQPRRGSHLARVITVRALLYNNLGTLEVEIEAHFTQTRA